MTSRANYRLHASLTLQSFNDSEGFHVTSPVVEVNYSVILMMLALLSEVQPTNLPR